MEFKEGCVRNICAVRSCSRTYLHPNARLFRFPRDPERCKQWAMACNQMIVYHGAIKAGSTMCNSYYRVCNRHFEDKYYTDERKKRLKFSAVPTLNLTREEVRKCMQLEKLRAQLLEADEHLDFIDIKDSVMGEVVQTEASSKFSDKYTQTESLTVSEEVQTDKVLAYSAACQTEVKLTLQIPRVKLLKKEVDHLRRKVKSLERQLDIETKKHKAKHEMLVEVLQRK